MAVLNSKTACQTQLGIIFITTFRTSAINATLQKHMLFIICQKQHNLACLLHNLINLYNLSKELQQNMDKNTSTTKQSAMWSGEKIHIKGGKEFEAMSSISNKSTQMFHRLLLEDVPHVCSFFWSQKVCKWDRKWLNQTMNSWWKKQKTTTTKLPM